MRRMTPKVRRLKQRREAVRRFDAMALESVEGSARLEGGDSEDSHAVASFDDGPSYNTGPLTL